MLVLRLIELTMSTNKAQFYHQLAQQLSGLLADENDLIANLANTSALLYHNLDDINWVGFYLVKGEELVLGPFQGKPACVRIAIGKGVCGTAVALGKTQLVADVHGFPGHIACDMASNSEIVVPLFLNNKIVGVLDVDSPSLRRFDQHDQRGLEAIAGIVELAISAI